MDIGSFIKTISLPEETWKQITNYSGYYISSFGRVLSNKRKKPILMKPTNKYLKGREYSRVTLHGEKRIVVNVHRLVATEFIKKPNNFNEIDHINNIGTDNRVTNLRWCTHKENMRNPLSREKKRNYRLAHPFERVGKYPRNVKISVFFNHHEDTMKPIVQIKEGAVVAQYKSLGEAERAGYKKVSISAVLHGRLKTYRGYNWMLLSDYIKIDPSFLSTSLE